ncbi:MAG TPA: deoxyribose-phosphate aldolase [Halococcus sp.]|nr:deoxyribose-phosphate aldolase [Halococcus sp.]
MDRTTFAATIDHTVLGPETTPAAVERVLGEAEEYGMNACVPPCYLDIATETASEVLLATVVGFPHGQHAPATKRVEAVRAWGAGADELDVVMNVGRLRAGEDEKVTRELTNVVAAVEIPVKVIIEAPLLTDDEKRRACECAVDADADFVKTATGFTEGGATVADVSLMSEFLQVKASGGIGSYEKANAMLEAGAARIGASSGVALVEGFDEWD